MRNLYILRYLGGLIWLIQLANTVHGQVPGVTAPRATLRLGSGQPIEVSAETAATGLVLRAGELRVPLPMREAAALTAEALSLKGGINVGVVRLTAAQRQAAVLLVRRGGTKLEALWVGRLDFAGDPGERRADVVEVADRDADGHPDIVVGHYDEQVSVCGDQHTLLAPRALDPTTLTLRSVLLNRASHRPVSLQLGAAATAPAGLTPPALLGALRPSGASSASTDPQHGVGALRDGDLHTFWEEGRGLGGRFEFASLKWQGPPRPIVALAVVPVPEGSAAGTHAQSRTLALLGPGGEHFQVKLPPDQQAGTRYWVTLPEPLSWRCMTLAFDELGGPTPTAQTHARLAEVEVYTSLDQSGGLAQLVRELNEPGTRGDEATALLQDVHADALGALVSAWPELSVLGRRRALRLLFQNTATSTDPRAKEVLRSALRDTDAEVAAQALKLAMGKLTFGAELLQELAGSATPQGDRAAQSIGTSGRPDALAVLLRLLENPGASERPALRDAIAEAYQRGAAQSGETLAGWTGAQGEAKSRAARAALALALSAVTPAHALALQLVHELSVGATAFDEQWRLVQATRKLPSEPRSDGFLETVAQRAETWMLRSAAIEALAERRAPNAQLAAQRALDDGYPRVRASAVSVLAKSPNAPELLAPKIRGDKWFLVRRAALDALPDSPAARAWFLDALSDPIATVRAAAIRSLARVGAAEAWQKIEPSLQNPEEYPDVITEAIGFTKALCLRAADPSLRMVVTRGLKPDAWDQDQELALEALEVLSSLGGDAAAWAKDRAASPMVPKEVQPAAAAALKQPVTCVPKGAQL